MPWDVFREGEQWCVHKLTPDGDKGEKVACHDSEEAAEAQMRALYASENGEFRIRRVSEFRGAFPDIPLAPGVDYAALTAGDNEPFFVTLPVVPEVGFISENNLLYDDELVSSLEQQIIEKRPGGIFGHVPESEPAQFRHPDVLWVGAYREGPTLWAKGYVPPGPGREHLRLKKAAGASISTSIYGNGDLVTANDIDPPVNRLINFKLENIDFAPPERAALGYSAPIIVTREQTQRRPTPQETTTMTLTKEQIAALKPEDLPAEMQQQILDQWRTGIAEMRRNVANRIGEMVQGDSPQLKAMRTAIVETAIRHAGENANEKQIGKKAIEIAGKLQPVIDGMRTTKSEQPDSKQVAELTQLRQRVAEYEAREFGRTLDETVKELTNWRVSADKQPRVDALRSQLRSGVLHRLGNDRNPNRVSEIAQEVWQEMQPIAQAVRETLTGPAAVVSGRVRGARQLDDSPEARQRARAETGI